MKMETLLNKATPWLWKYKDGINEYEKNDKNYV